MKSVTQSFLRRLTRQCRLHRAGLLCRGLLRVAGSALIALVVYAVADYFLAFSQTALTRIGAALLATFAALAVLAVARALRFSAFDYAEHADRVQRNRRQDVLSALELSRAKPGADSFSHFLVDQSVSDADTRLRSLRLKQIAPTPALRRQGLVFGLQCAVAALALGLPFSVSKIILGRICFPERDRPPFSRYRFAIQPDQPGVLYGQSVEIAVEITGAPLRGPVYLMTRHGGRVQRAACFQESPERFAQRLERVVQPIEFAFQTGRARSEWRTVDVLLDPRIAAARATIAPPAYSGKPARSIVPGEEALAELLDARLELEVVSNRPLLDGTLTLRASDGSGEEQVVAGRAGGPNRMRFDWILRRPAELEVTIRDVRGTRNQQPFILQQRILPDEPPRAWISEPAAYALATPAATVRLAGHAEDDLALRRVDLVRGLVGFRDRVAPLGPDAPRRRWGFETDLDMAHLGVEPGQVMEFYLEAQDTNPAWTGVGASEVVRIEIISNEDYAELLRTRIRTEDFVERYRAVMQSVRRLREQLEEARDMVESGDADLAAKLKAFQGDFEDAHRLIRQLASDFPAFDAETDFHEMLDDLAGMMDRHQQRVRGLAPDSEFLKGTLEMMARQFREFEQPLSEQMEIAEDIARISRLFELTRWYLQIVQAQEQLNRRMDRYPDPTRIRDPALFESFRREEAAIRDSLLRFRDQLVQRANELTDEHEALKTSALEFAEAIGELQIPEILEDVLGAAAGRDGRQMTQQADRALERMRQLVQECSGDFGGLMECEIRFEVRDRLRNTLNQMMSAWAGLSAALASGGDIGDGYSTTMHTALNVPMFGPGRHDIMQRTTAGGPGSESGTYGQSISEGARQVLRPDLASEERGDAPPIEQAPEKYRDALRRYFGIPEETP